MEGESKPKSLQCSQCSKPAVMLLGDHPLCIDCNYKFQQSQWMQFTQHAAMINMLDKEMTDSVGMPQLSNPISIPPAPIPPIHYNNQTVTVTGGTVGAINFGNVHDIQVNLQALTQNGEIGIADAMASLTNSILDANEIAEAEKNELLEQISFLSAQASAPPAERKQGMIKTLVSAVNIGAGAVSSVATAWAAAEPLLKGHFGL